MLVPLSTAVEVSVAIPTLWTLTPGAKISTAVPKLENEALASLPSMAPTVIAVAADPGDVFKASCYSELHLARTKYLFSGDCNLHSHFQLQRQLSHQFELGRQLPN